MLSGIRVLDMTNVLAGPFCCHQLAHMGAEVIKIEAVGRGDLARQLGADKQLSAAHMGISFLAQNAGKKSLSRLSYWCFMSKVKEPESYIRLLPDTIIDKIAAGEVIQRPASVVKELLDNAIDAGADHIQLVIEQSGRTLIQVTDNGCGMSEVDLERCFTRHATSKIQGIDDLYAIRTRQYIQYINSIYVPLNDTSLRFGIFSFSAGSFQV